MKIAVLLLSASSLFVAGCNNDCDFFERCKGNVREVCGEGPDQMFNRKIHRFPCADEAPSTACVEIDEDNARCVLPEKTKCDDSFERSCDGEVLLTCSDEIVYTGEKSPPRYVVGTTCADDDRVCVDYGGDASCVESAP
jgi:hypothetical protein